MTDIDKAKELFRQVVYRSREGRFPARAGLCGLGERSPVFQGIPADLGPLVKELFAAAGRRERVEGLLSSWLEEKDKFDRERNHFLKRFRNEHGFDRTAYDAATAKAFDAGLDEINGREEAGLAAHARKLLDA